MTFKVTPRGYNRALAIPRRRAAQAGRLDWTRVVRSWAGVAALLTAACQPDASRSNASSPPPESSAEPTLDLRAEGPWPARYSSDPLWQRAAGGDDFALARLAQSQGATRLVQALGHGGGLGRTALAALAYAEDRRLARRSLCGWLARAEPETRGALLVALHEVVTTGPRNESTISPSDDRACVAALEALQGSESLSESSRDRLAGSLAALSER